jgi:hypothetical protein
VRPPAEVAASRQGQRRVLRHPLRGRRRREAETLRPAPTAVAESSPGREQAERKRDDLAARLAALEEARESPQTAAEEPGGVEDASITSPAPQEAAESRSWWRRWFGFE